MNNNSDGIRFFRHKGQGRYLLFSNKTGILISKDVYCLWQANNRAWSPGNRITTLYLNGTHILSTRTYRINRTKCKKCDKVITVANMARHQKSKACL